MRVFLRFGIPDLGGRDSFDGEIRCRGRPMSQPRDDRQDDLFRPPLEEIINLRHPLVRLAGRSIGTFWRDASARCVGWDPGSRRCRRGWWPGYSFSSIGTTSPTEALCERWVENPYFQYFCIPARAAI